MASHSYKGIYLEASHNSIFPFVGATSQKEFACNISLSLSGKNSCIVQRSASEGQGACCQIWHPEFDPQEPHSRMRESAFLTEEICSLSASPEDSLLNSHTIVLFKHKTKQRKKKQVFLSKNPVVLHNYVDKYRYMYTELCPWVTVVSFWRRHPKNHHNLNNNNNNTFYSVLCVF